MSSAIAIVLVWCALFLSPIVAQTREYRFQNLSSTQGLPNALSRCIVQDSAGFIWLGTAAGLARYDGAGFQVHASDPKDSTSLPCDIITALAVGDRTTLWVGCVDGQLSAFNIVKRSFRRVYVSTEGRHRINALCADRRGSLWVGTGGGGVLQLDSIGRTIRHLTDSSGDGKSIRWNIIDAIAEGKDGTIYVGTPVGLRAVTDTGAVNLFEGDTIQAICVAGENELWLSVNGGLGLFDLRSKRVVRRIPIVERVSVIRTLEESTVWTGTFLGGIRVIDTQSGRVAEIKPRSDQPQGLLGHSVLDIFHDRAGILWFATDRGVSRLTDRARRFAFYRRSSTPTGAFVSAIGEENDGTIWIGGRGIRRFAPGLGVRAESGMDAWLRDSAYIYGILGDRWGGLWIGTERGLYHRRGNATQFEALPVRYRVRAMAMDSRGTLWIASFDPWLRAFNAHTMKVERIFHSAEGNALGEGKDIIVRLFVDRSDNLWIATEGSGLICRDHASGAFLPYRHDAADSASISNDRVYDVLQSHSKILWVTTGSGLDIFHPAQRTFTHVPWLDGMTASQPLNLQEDAAGNLWITMYGPAISRLDRATQRVTRYFAEEGYLEEAIMGALLRTSKGELLVGGMDGLIHFRPEEIVDRADSPPVQFTKLSIAGKPTLIDTEIDEGVLELSHTENYLAFSMVTLDYVNPRRNRLRYQLVGADPAPVEVEGAGTADYSGLAPGSYTLRITGANSDGYWNPVGLSVPIRIHPPWWQSWYFRLGVVAAIALLALYLLHVRVEGLLERERFKVKMSAELHDEIGSGLTRIALLSEIAQRKSAESPTQAGDAFQRIAQLARELHEAMGDVVWSINPKHDTMESFIQRATRYLNEVCEARGIVLTLHVDEHVASLHANPEMLRNLLLVTKEAMTNVVRHAACDRSEVHIRREGSAMVLTVVDDGKGMDLAGSVQGNGLRNMRKRVEQLGGMLTVWSERGTGTKLHFVIPTNAKRVPGE